MSMRGTAPPSCWSQAVLTFRATIATLRAHFRCLVMDLPGLGLSQAPLYRGQAFARNADWLECFVRALGLDRFTLALHATAGPLRP